MNSQDCKIRLQIINVNSNEYCNKYKYRCQCKELIDKGICDKGFIRDPSNCDCECDKSYNIGQYLDYKNCKCRKKLVGKLVEECNEEIDGIK